MKIIAAFLLAFGTSRENRLNILFLEGNQMTIEKLEYMMELILALGSAYGSCSALWLCYTVMLQETV